MRNCLSLAILCGATAAAAFIQRDTIAEGFCDPMSRAIAPDGDVYLVEREGRILRIRPTETGYEIPPANLFPVGTAKTRPEIFAMGCRNPFRMSIDRKNRTVYWGEVGSDVVGASCSEM